MPDLAANSQLPWVCGAAMTVPWLLGAWSATYAAVLPAQEPPRTWA